MSGIAILGAGSWGTALAVLLGDAAPVLWDHDEARAITTQTARVNTRYLPGVRLPDSVRVTSHLSLALRGAEIVVFAVPSHAVRNVARRVRDTTGFDPQQIIVNVAKGLEEQTGRRLSQVLAEELPQPVGRIVSLVGPSHAEEVARCMPTTVVAAGTDPEVLHRVQDIFSTETFRVYTNDDVTGVELAVALKNVIAIAAGIADGLGFGDNTKGALLTRGLAEMARLGIALGARTDTFAGLAGLGDLVTTATSRHSRNRNLGEAIARGRSLEDALHDLGMVAEGVPTARAAVELARARHLEIPISEQVFAVLFEKKDPRQSIRDLMVRAPRAEAWSDAKGGS
jgi:glycerol-3-phosphate dehydrogenase (NAD(P)+)